MVELDTWRWSWLLEKIGMLEFWCCRDGFLGKSLLILVDSRLIDEFYQSFLGALAEADILKCYKQLFRISPY